MKNKSAKKHIKICVVCKKEFTAISNKKLFCSEPCREEHFHKIKQNEKKGFRKYDTEKTIQKLFTRRTTR